MSTHPASADRSSPESRTRILDAAELLMAERGVDAVSLREINTAAGQKNASAVQYHFGNREGLVQAVVARHMVEVDERRNRLLDALEAQGRTGDVHALTAALVEPLAERLSTPSGRRYLRIVQHLADRRSADGAEVRVETINRSLQRFAGYFSALDFGLPPRVLAERHAQIASFLIRALADQARRLDERARAPMGNELFTANLIDVLVGVATAPASEDTRRLARR